MNNWISVDNEEDPPSNKILFLYDQYEEEFSLGYYDEEQHTFTMMKMKEHAPDSEPTHWMLAVAPEEQ